MATATAPHRFISYLRVSTQKQGYSGLGIEAQREAVRQYMHAVGNGEPLKEFKEVESGKRDDRPELTKALAACKLHRATLVVAKLDRLARNVAFISKLMESGVEFVACDFPQANRLTVHILAAVAEHEREIASQRTKAALTAAKKRGVKLGGPKLKPGTAKSAAAARRAHMEKAKQQAEQYREPLDAARKAGAKSLRDIARYFSEAGLPTARGAETWTATAVSRLLRHLGE
jgi:DNA invertase Pin-like site-specific DNA recombinase